MQWEWERETGVLSLLVNLTPGKDNVYNHLWMRCIHESDPDGAQDLSVLQARCVSCDFCIYTNMQGINRLSKACLGFAAFTLK